MNGTSGKLLSIPTPLKTARSKARNDSLAIGLNPGSSSLSIHGVQDLGAAT
jgi:hypothetical protein